MGNWVSVYREEPADARAIGSKSEAVLRHVLQANPDLTAGAQQCLQRLIEGEVPSDEQFDGADFVRSFRAICHAYAEHETTVEIYVDEEQFPEIWELVWEAEIPYGLPLSEAGSPAIGYWNAAAVTRFDDLFVAVDLAALAERNKGQRYEQEIAAVREVLSAARAAGCGVYVFFEE
ncbi:MAG TPA: hypothetical protein VKU01_15290 [Bryobacteraceae bacterium]|nr:hypothetical protein [Bryobacteraceae bacterium]